jgi:hypothetical protein
MHFDMKKSAASGKGAALSGGLDLQPSFHAGTLPTRPLPEFVWSGVTLL